MISNFLQITLVWVGVSLKQHVCGSVVCPSCRCFVETVINCSRWSATGAANTTPLWLKREVKATTEFMPAEEFWVHACQCLQKGRLELLFSFLPQHPGWCVRDPVSPFICLLTAALRVEVLLQGCYVSVPAQSVNVLRVWGPAEEHKGFLVGLGGAEPSQVAAQG